MKKFVFYTLFILLAAYIILQILPKDQDRHNGVFLKEDEVLMVAHGGFKAMNPENTWMAYEYAVKEGADILEVDIQLTKDNHLVAVHNDNIIDYTGVDELATNLTLKELEALNFGQNFVDINGNTPYKDADLSQYDRLLAPANVKELFERYGKEVGYLIEIKDELNYKYIADTLIQWIDEYDLYDYVCISSFSDEIMNYVLSLKDERIITLFDEKAATDFVIANYAGYGYFLDFPQNGFSLPTEQYHIPLNTEYLTYKIHKNDMFVYYWTINTKEEMKACIKAGADGIVTDRPDLLKEVFAELKENAH